MSADRGSSYDKAKSASLSPRGHDALAVAKTSEYSRGLRVLLRRGILDEGS
jgi:hypothetical protein